MAALYDSASALASVAVSLFRRVANDSPATVVSLPVQSTTPSSSPLLSLSSSGIGSLATASSAAALALTTALSSSNTPITVGEYVLTSSALPFSSSVAAGAAASSSSHEEIYSSPLTSQIARILRNLAAVIVKQTAEVDIPDRRIGTFVAYLTSPFAQLCIIMAVVLNRTVVFASVRRPQNLSLIARLLIGSLAVYQLTRAVGPLLTGLKCYSPVVGPYIPGYFAVDTEAGEKCPGVDILWTLYKAFCTGQFVETFSSAVQGRVPSPDTGMTLFEYSLAFQEAQSAQRPSVEILTISLLWALNFLTYLTLSIFDLQVYRLIPSSFFGILSLVYFAVSTYNGRAQSFPTVWVIGFAPHLAVLYVIVLCGAIYILASFFSGGTSNLQASVRTVNISLSEDFYSCLLKLGIVVLTSAAGATYMSEGPVLAVPESTWLEALEYQRQAGFEHINDVPVAGQGTSSALQPPVRLRDRIKFSLDDLSEPNAAFSNGFKINTRRKNQFLSGGSGNRTGAVLRRTPRRRRISIYEVTDGVATSTRTETSAVYNGYATNNTRVGKPVTGADANHRKAGRFKWLVIIYRVRMAYRLVRWMITLLEVLFAKFVYYLKERFSTLPEQSTESETVSGSERENSNSNSIVANAKLMSDDEYYDLFLSDQVFPEEDPTEDFSPDEDEEDDYDYVTDVEDEVTSSAVLTRSASSRPLTNELFPELGTAELSLSSLLMPQTLEERQLTNVILTHLAAPEIVTRQRMEQYQQRQYDELDWESEEFEDDEYTEEALKLASLITNIRESSQVRRSRHHHNIAGAGEVDSDDEEVYRPNLCVVCHTSARCIVLWPCRCLAVCEDCRLSLALRNFKGCVCCRRDVVSFSRLYVP
ncbi:uncharacterized protein V1516DRAFT_675594 [Lipomyces oligophaga]|uniref:uncharacterized protein n=1 Tax=Lipomyces oligophaga TaxID=45792 RepID=UPI0034CD8C6E